MAVRRVLAFEEDGPSHELRLPDFVPKFEMNELESWMQDHSLNVLENELNLIYSYKTQFLHHKEKKCLSDSG